jgi:hypothetical protein
MTSRGPNFSPHGCQQKPSTAPGLSPTPPTTVSSPCLWPVLALPPPPRSPSRRSRIIGKNTQAAIILESLLSRCALLPLHPPHRRHGSSLCRYRKVVAEAGPPPRASHCARHSPSPVACCACCSPHHPGALAQGPRRPVAA